MSANGIRFLYQFSVGEYNYQNPGVNVVSVTSTAAGDHDKVNLTTSPLRQTWRSTDTTNQEIVIQANDTTVTPDIFAILNHNLTEDAVVTLQCAYTNDFSAPALTVPFIWNEKHMAIVQDLGQAYSYYKIKIIDPGNPCGFVEIGRIVAGQTFAFTNNEDIDDGISISTDDLASTMQTEGFFRASNERVKLETLQVKFPKLSSRNGEDTNYKGLIKMMRFVGTTQPFLTVVDPNEPYFSLMWGQLKMIPGRMYSINRYTDFNMSIEEVY
jgi:hypothetical protein